ncbi:TAF6-like RNA polymerase II p300/CBP-associated factor-associated factor 65 kDa subunit 6L [Bulinus truncatus]|nr:TAF6-like RNA polymerase II p300/CBP-associated factor-associated factor 65 kDa subunit 6L [Bulinus truncatus]
MASEDRPHLMEEKTYAVFTSASVNAMAESARFSPIPHEAAVALGEDASYRVRQVVMLATQYMKHAKRRRLGVDDFNRAAKELNVMGDIGSYMLEKFRSTPAYVIPVIDAMDTCSCLQLPYCDRKFPNHMELGLKQSQYCGTSASSASLAQTTPSSASLSPGSVTGCD